MKLSRKRGLLVSAALTVSSLNVATTIATAEPKFVITGPEDNTVCHVIDVDISDAEAVVKKANEDFTQKSIELWGEFPELSTRMQQLRKDVAAAHSEEERNRVSSEATKLFADLDVAIKKRYNLESVDKWDESQAQLINNYYHWALLSVSQSQQKTSPTRLRKFTEGGISRTEAQERVIERTTNPGYEAKYRSELLLAEIVKGMKQPELEKKFFDIAKDSYLKAYVAYESLSDSFEDGCINALGFTAPPRNKRPEDNPNPQPTPPGNSGQGNNQGNQGDDRARNRGSSASGSSFFGSS